jgi:2-oxo-4-hydroxy-4-carboxy-5-ureidoimidazoline decarboxylase
MTERNPAARPVGPAAEPLDPAADPLDPAARLSIDRLDVIAPGAFAAAVSPLFEGARGFLGRLAMSRPFGSVDALFASAREIAHAMPADEQVELIDAHPRLGAPPASVSALSFIEQAYDRGTQRSPEATDAEAAETARADLQVELDRVNAAYETRFGFRYCVFVAGRSRAELLPGMIAALDASRDDEIVRALDAVVDIARDRYATLTTSVWEAHP